MHAEFDLWQKDMSGVTDTVNVAKIKKLHLLAWMLLTALPSWKVQEEKKYN